MNSSNILAQLGLAWISAQRLGGFGFWLVDLELGLDGSWHNGSNHDLVAQRLGS